MSPLKRVLIALIALGVAVIFALLALHLATGGYVPSHYAIVFELNSANTSVYSYTWSADELNGTGIVSIDDYCSTHMSIRETEERSKWEVKLLTPCFEKILAKTEDVDMDNVHVFSGATSTIWMLNESNPEIASRQLGEIDRMLMSESSKYSKIHMTKTQMVSGDNEALYMWIALNSQLKNIGDIEENQREETIGLISIGSISTLFAHETFDPSLVGTSVTIPIYGHNYTLRAKGDMCSGIEQIKNKYLIKLILDHNSSNKLINNPCDEANNTQTINGKEFESIGCVFKHGSVPINTTKLYYFIGTQDYESCLQAIESVFEPSSCLQNFSFCSHIEKNSPPKDISFSLIFQNPKLYFKRDFTKNISSLESYVNFSKDACSQDSIERVTGNTYLPQCFIVNYIYVLLTKVYKFGGEEWTNIQFHPSFNSVPHWSLGYTINQTSPAPSVPPSESFINVYVLAILQILVIILIGVAAYFLFCKRKDKKLKNVRIY